MHESSVFLVLERYVQRRLVFKCSLLSIIDGPMLTYMWWVVAATALKARWELDLTGSTFCWGGCASWCGEGFDQG